MSNSFKIRLLLFLLVLSFATTALTLNLTFHKEDVLAADGLEIKTNLQRKEKFVKDFLNDTKTFDALKTVEHNKMLANSMVEDMWDKRRILLYTYHDHKLDFWNANRTIPLTDAGLRDGTWFRKLNTISFIAIKKSEGNFSVVCYIPVKANYAYENQYLKNIFAVDLTSSNNLEVAGLNDKQEYPIRSIDGKYLFSLKLKSTLAKAFYSDLELWFSLIAALLACIFMNYICYWISEKGYVKTAITVFLSFFLLCRIFSLQYNWLHDHFAVPIFDPKYYSYNFFFPSLGDFLVNIICATWFLAFAYSLRFKIFLSESPVKKWTAYLVFILLGVIITLIAIQVDDIFHGLVTSSTINFDVTNILNLDKLSWLGIALLCMAVLCMYLLVETTLVIGQTLSIPLRHRFFIFMGGVVFILIGKLISNDFNMFFLLFAGILFIRGWAIYKKNNEFNIAIIVSTILIFAIISSAKLWYFQNEKEIYLRKQIAKKLESSDDPNAVKLFAAVEQQIVNDELIIEYFRSGKGNPELLEERLQKFYFDGYLSRFEFTSYEFRPNATKVKGDSIYVEKYKKLVLSGTIKVTNYFYHVNNTFGSQDYFGILPIYYQGQNLGSMIIEMKSKTLHDPSSFPAVLVDGRLDMDDGAYENYSFAFYKDDRLVTQYGKFVYDLVNNDFTGRLRKFKLTERKGYGHLLYQQKRNTLIVVSKPIINLMTQLASVSFMFLLLLTFFSACVVINLIWKNVSTYRNIFMNFRWGKFFAQSRVLYKTRIQASMVAAVVGTLLLVGGITYYSISEQYKEQQKQSVLEDLDKIVLGFEKHMFNTGEMKVDEATFSAFAGFNAVDLTYFDIHGRMLYTTQPKIFENELLGDRINAKAFVHLNNFHQSEYLNDKERIGQLFFLEAYKPIRNSNNETVGYLGLPYFSNVRDFEVQIGQFLNSLINVYALVFVAIGFFAVFIANQITAPLTLVQKSLSQTKIDRKNEAIVWKRNDEIGGLVKEYNNMIAALEESAQRLASSERETAWKEMAKQVAHEIKNPLTPLKLGVQLLDKSWKEKDPNFDKKFERFSKSFIEQIESLSHIASEFSNFAKMPETQLESVKLREILEQSIEVYSKVEHVNIVLEDKIGPERMIKGDKDQLLRCFNNLIKNGIEAIPEYRDGQIDVVMEEHEDFVHVQIRDNGKGIPEGLRQRIFNPNFTTKSSGTGLGLAFVKQAIGNMGGSIRFETSHDSGTTFYITLPIAG